MRLLGLGLVVLCACGGSDSSVGLDGGGDGTTSDVTNPNDGGPPSDSGGDVNNQSDSSSDAGGGDAGDGGSFNVGGVSGLALWLKSDTGVTAMSGVVSEWADQSGNSNNASESRAGLQPTVLVSGINGLPTIHFASAACANCLGGFQGNDLLINDSPTLEWGTTDFLVEVVARYSNDPTSVSHDAFGALYISIYGPPNTATAGLGLYGNVFKEPNDLATSSAIEAYIWGQPAAISSGAGYNNDLPHVFAIQRVGTTLSVRIDAAAVGSQTIASADTGKTGGRLGGCENAQAQRLEGDISEVIAVKGTIAPSDLTGIEGYLKARYATP